MFAAVPAFAATLVPQDFSAHFPCELPIVFLLFFYTKNVEILIQKQVFGDFPKNCVLDPPRDPKNQKNSLRSRFLGFPRGSKIHKNRKKTHPKKRSKKRRRKRRQVPRVREHLAECAEPKWPKLVMIPAGSRQVSRLYLKRPATPGGVRRIQTLRAFRRPQLDVWMLGCVDVVRI